MTDKNKEKELKILFKKYRKYMWEYRELKEMKQPVILLITQGNRVKFIEGVKGNVYNFKHTDGDEKFIALNRKQLVTFDYGKKDFKGYICHEDYPTALPQNPVMTIDEFNGAIEKTLNDNNEWRAKREKYRGDFMWKVLIGIAVIIGVYFLGKMVLGNTGVQTVQQIPQIIQQPQQAITILNETIKNTTQIINPIII